jgi:hypothetical protein
MRFSRFMIGEPPVKSLEYYVLKDGEMLGPFDEDQLRVGLANGQFAAGDFFQPSHETKWRPIRSLLDPEQDEADGAVAPDWGCILKWAWLRLRHGLGEGSVRAGGVCLGIGTAVLILSRWPFLFWIPWFVATAIAAVALIRRKREAHGTVLLMFVVCVPMAYFIFGLRRESGPSKAEVKTAAVPAAPLAARPSATVEAPAEVEPAPATPVAEAAPKPGESPIPGLPVGVDAETPAPRLIKPTYVHAPPESTPRSSAQHLLVIPAPASAQSAPNPASSQPSTASAASAAQSSTPAPVEDVPLALPSESLVIVKGPDGSGSGFICRAKNQTWLFTNIHVVADIKQATITRLDNQSVYPGGGEVAAGPDVSRFTLAGAQAPAHPLELMTDLENNVKIGDEVVVLGNSGGGGVVTRLKGKLVGIGPDRIEVSAEFIPGNSGSPIIHVKSGKVIGIATYLTRRPDSFAKGGTGEMVVRRFGYRLDTVSGWEPINWPVLYNDADQIKRIDVLTGDIVHFLNSSRDQKDPEFATDTLRRPANEWLSMIHAKSVSSNDRISATQSFLNALRNMVRSDVAVAESQVRYTYFRNRLTDEKRVREALFKAFDADYGELGTASMNRKGYR